MTDMWAVDPGDVHVGLAIFERGDTGLWRCVDACELTPDEFLLLLAQQMVQGTIDILVYERFILEPDQAAKLAGTEMETSQMIGAIKWIHGQCARRHNAPDVELVGQPNKIKKPMRGVLNHRKIRSITRRLGVTGDHAKDAELHGYYHIIKTLEQKVES